MKQKELPKEETLMLPVVAVLGSDQYRCYSEVRFGRKRIDLLLVPACDAPWIAVELKIRDWKRALWQAVINREVADICFVALYEKFIPAALAQKDLFESYGIGIISVLEDTAAIVLQSTTVHNLTRQRQQLLTSLELGKRNGDHRAIEAVPVLPT